METTVITIFAALLMSAVVESSEEEYNLLKKLLNKYDTNVRPVINSSESIVVNLGIGLNQIIDLDERNQILTIKVYMRLRWRDQNLVWNSSDYNGLRQIRIQADRIWLPDITLYTDVSEDSKIQGLSYSAIVTDSGTIQWNFPAVLRTTCDLQVKYFPWDQQACPLKFGSWSFDKSTLDLLQSDNSADLSTFIKNGEFEMIGVPVKRHELTYGCCATTYPDVTFWVVMRRKALYYTFNLLLPCLFITATTILVFYLPPESGEKISLGMTGLLALTVFLLLVAETLPPQSDSIPLIGQYFAATIVLLSMSTALTVVILNIFHRGEYGKEVPDWIKTLILNYLGRVLLLNRTIKTNASHRQNKNNNEPDHVRVENKQNNDCESNNINSEGTNLKKTETTYTLIEIRDFLDEIRSRHRDKVSDDGCRTDWMLVAIVMDRLFLVTFVILSVIISLTLLLSYPTYDDFDLESVTN